MNGERVGMDIEVKDGISLLGVAAVIGGHWAWVKSKLKGQGQRIYNMERRLTDEHGEPLMMTLMAHDIICPRNTGVLMAEMQHVAEAVRGLSAVVAEQNKKLTTVAETVAIIEDRAQRRRGSDDGK